MEKQENGRRKGEVMSVRVMIADDESMIRLLVRDIIETYVSGVTVVGEAADGDECLDLFQKLNPQIIITDVVMPHTDGLELLRQIKAISPEVLIILLSAHKKFEYVHEAIKEQAFDYLLKPTREEDIKRVFGRALKVLEEKEKNKALYSEMKRKIKKYGSQITVKAQENSADSSSPDYLSTQFKVKTGKNFKDYISNLRIQKAEELLMCSEFKISEVAELMGYNDSGYFIKVFKNKLGCTPSQFRESKRRDDRRQK